MLRVLCVALMCGALLGTSARAEEPEPVEYVRVCDVYGAGFFYIPGTETCLRIGDGGTERVQLGDDRGDYASGRSFKLGPIAVDDIRIAVSPSFVWQAPTARGFLAWENGVDVFAPAFSSNVAYQGFNLGVTIGDRLSVDRFGPFDMETRINLGATTGSASGGGFTEDDLRIPGVGVTPGPFLPGTSDIVSYNFQSQRAYAGVEKMFGFPLAAWSPEPNLGIGLSAGVGVRGNLFQQTEKSTFQIDDGALHDVAYDTSFTGAGIGAVAGIKVNAAYDLGNSGTFDSLPEDMMLKKALGLYLGYDQYSVAVRDRVDVTGGATYASENSFSVSVGSPVVRAESEIAIGNSALEFYVKGGIGTAATPTIGYLREDSIGGVTPLQPKVTLNGSLGYDLSLGLRGKF